MVRQRLSVRTAVMVSFARLREEPYASILCYPRSIKAEVGRRLKELQKLDIEALEFGGEKEAFGVRVLGKGCVGIVVKAFVKGQMIALKIRRVDADRVRMRHESEMLRKANSVEVGPELLGVSRNFLLMRFIDGDLLPHWLDGRVRKALVKRVLREILEQCWRMDETGLDHGELSHAPKHVIVDRKNAPVIVDFETASVYRRPSNVTSICQYFFFSGETAKKVGEKLGGKDESRIVEVLRRYKQNRNRENFERVLTVCGL
jgi:putative serine/threonine protein kinase